MKVGVISDVHGNRIALEAVLADMPAVDRLVCAGDVVGYNPWPADCVEAMRQRSVPTVLGNHDRAVATGDARGFNGTARAGVEYAREQLEETALAWLADLPERRTVCDGRIRLVHGHPDDPDRYTYPRSYSPELLDGEAVLVTGHTHVQGHAQFPEGIVMNPGSVGQPRDRDPRAAYAVVDLAAGDVEERRVEYDIGAVVDAIEAAGLPDQLARRLYDGR